MKKLLSILMAVIISLSMLPIILATSTGNSLGVTINTEEFAPILWLCDTRVVTDDALQGGRISGDGEEMVERINNYAFQGEQISWVVLAMDKNGFSKIADVYVTVGTVQGEGNPIEANCMPDPDFSDIIEPACNARIAEEDLTGREIDSAIQGYYTCSFTVETPESMQGESWVTIEAVDIDGLMGTIDEHEFWYLNPAIFLGIEGTLDFGTVRPGTAAYSETILVRNEAADGSGVMLDMFITGTDFYDSSSSGAKCPTSNELKLSSFRYYAVNGAYTTVMDLETDNNEYDPVTTRDLDVEGYVNIQYGTSFEETVYDEAEVLQAQPVGPYYTANLLAPGAEMAVTFKLNMPEPCNGDFDTGDIFFWGEAI